MYEVEIYSNMAYATTEEVNQVLQALGQADIAADEGQSEYSIDIEAPIQVREAVEIINELGFTTDEDLLIGNDD